MGGCGGGAMGVWKLPNNTQGAVMNCCHGYISWHPFLSPTPLQMCFITSPGLSLFICARGLKLFIFEHSAVVKLDPISIKDRKLHSLSLLLGPFSLLCPFPFSLSSRLHSSRPFSLGDYQ